MGQKAFPGEIALMKQPGEGYARGGSYILIRVKTSGYDERLPNDYHSIQWVGSIASHLGRRSLIIPLCLLVPWGRRHLQLPQSWIQSEDGEGAQHVNFRGGAILGVGLGLQFDPQAPGDVS